MLFSVHVPKTSGRIAGKKLSKDEIKSQILSLLKKEPLTPSEIANHFGRSRARFSVDYIYPLVKENKIEKISGCNSYKLTEQKTRVRQLAQRKLNKEQIFQTKFFKNWKKRVGHKKNHRVHMSYFARICLGLTTPEFKIDPDTITLENWTDVCRNMVEALEKVKPLDEEGLLCQGLRDKVKGGFSHGLGMKITRQLSEELKIQTNAVQPKNSDLHITSEQVQKAKDILRDESNSIFTPPLEHKPNTKAIPYTSHLHLSPLLWFLKFGVKTWTFVRPSTIYIIEISNMKFYNRTVHYVELNGKKYLKKEMIEFAQNLLAVFPQAKNSINIGSYSHRACHIKVYENKQKKDFNKYIYDEDFVIPLEKYWNDRKSKNKKYLFWDDDNEEFDFYTYTDTVSNQVRSDNSFYKKLLSEIGFKREDFGTYFRANYGFRHFGLQMWLIETDYNYELVAEMSHETTTILKKFYGKRTSENFEKSLKETFG